MCVLKVSTVLRVLWRPLLATLVTSPPRMQRVITRFVSSAQRVSTAQVSLLVNPAMQDIIVLVQFSIKRLLQLTQVISQIVPSLSKSNVFMESTKIKPDSLLALTAPRVNTVTSLL